METRLYGLDLFSGIGGNTIALNEYIKTIAYCEFDRHAQGVLLSRMRSGAIEPAPIWDDIKTLTSKQFSSPIDIIVGGFPCQDISVAGKQEGIKLGNRSGLFYEIIRLIKELRPTFVFLENVPGIRTRGLGGVLQELRGPMAKMLDPKPTGAMSSTTLRVWPNKPRGTSFLG